MSVITAADLTWNGEEVKALSEAIYEGVYSKPELTKFHTIVSGIKAKKQIVLLGALGLVGLKQDSCSVTPNAGTITMSEKFWNPEYVGDRFQQCWTDLKESFFIWGLKSGKDKANLDKTDFAMFFSERLEDAMKEMIYRIAWFNDTDAALVTDSPAGTVTAGTTIGYFNIIDGFWKQLFAIVAADSTRKDSSLLATKNAQATFSAQAFDSTDTTNKIAEVTYQNLKYSADFRLREEAGLIILSTQSLVDQYAKELRSRNIDASFTRIEGGYTSLEFEGIEIIGISIWDRMIRTYFSNGTKYYLPHRAVLTTKENLQIGVEEVGNLSDFEPFYDQTTKLFNVDFGFNIDAKVIEDYKVQVAY
jgi:hypothetical protein